MTNFNFCPIGAEVEYKPKEKGNNIMNKRTKMIGIGAAILGFSAVTAHLTAKAAAAKIDKLTDFLAETVGSVFDVHTDLLEKYIKLSDSYETLNNHFDAVCDDYDVLLAEYEELLNEAEKKMGFDKDVTADEDTESV